VTELQRSVGFPALTVVEDCVTPVKPRRTAVPLQLPERLQTLGAVLERLWQFYEAMHRGLPLPNHREVLPEMKTALKGKIGPGDPVNRA
jgi:hypothetical protein